MIKVSDYGWLIDIQWDVHNVNETARSSLLSYLLSLSSPSDSHIHVALKFYFGAWNTELFITPIAAYERILDSIDHTFVPAGENITIAAIDVDDTCDSHVNIQDFLALWYENKGFFSAELAEKTPALINNTLIWSLNDHADILTYQNAGASSFARDTLGEEWCFKAIGNTLEHVSGDKDYDSEVTADYPRVMTENTPQLDHIRAYFHVNNADPIWLNYERLLLPWTDEIGKPHLMCLSQQTQNLRVPFFESTIAA